MKSVTWLVLIVYAKSCAMKSARHAENYAIGNVNMLDAINSAFKFVPESHAAIIVLKHARKDTSVVFFVAKNVHLAGLFILTMKSISI